MEKKLVIVVSGPPGVGTSSVAKEIAKKLKLRFLSPGKTYKSFLKEKEAKAALEFWKTEFGKSKELHQALDKNQIEEAKKGNVVICGKLSIHFLKEIADLKVWLEAPLEIRAERTAKRDNIPFEEALKQISERENIERKKWKEIYGFDYFELKKDADLILDTSNLSLEETVKKILDFMRTKALI
ncbi:MAG: cytidylate kinase family protein [Candidatus Aenigmarchaeota archaeon]|nr:cytidylate kinase family protein [Candidatus Aenigmarchaeota archaeon]